MTAPSAASSPAHRRALLLGLPALLLGCGGGGGTGTPEPPPLEGTLDARVLRARGIGVDYPLRIYLPPASAGPRSALPVLFVLDGETWFDVVMTAADTSRTGVIVVGINSASRREIDLVPPNTCNPAGGGGQAAHLAWIRDELLPYVHAQFGGDPAQRALFGHSHGGGFVLFALLAEAAGTQAFRHYLACDASLGCYYPAAMGWQEAYAAAYRALPVRLLLSHASEGNVLSNVPWAEALAARRFEAFDFRTQPYTGTHGGIVPRAVSDGLTWLRAAG